jgi:hypothetical protein
MHIHKSIMHVSMYVCTYTRTVICNAHAHTHIQLTTLIGRRKYIEILSQTSILVWSHVCVCVRVCELRHTHIHTAHHAHVHSLIGRRRNIVILFQTCRGAVYLYRTMCVCVCVCFGTDFNKYTYTHSLVGEEIS